MTRRLWQSPILKGVVGGAAGVVLALLVWHAWVDHRELHRGFDQLKQDRATLQTVVKFLNDTIAAQAKAAGRSGQ